MNLPLILALVLVIVLIVVIQRRLPGHPAGVDVRLLRAVGGDRQLAKRLLDQVQWRYPGKSERWYVEKVLYDLDRDRGRY